MCGHSEEETRKEKKDTPGFLYYDEIYYLFSTVNESFPYVSS